jgi:hypothetical protein
VNGQPRGCNPGYGLGAVIVVDDKSQKADFGPVVDSSTAPPADLISRNAPGQMPWAFDPSVAWVTDFGADPTGATDSTAAIRKAISAAHANGSDEVFLPRGKYNLSGTLTLYPNTRFFGLPGGYTQLQAPDWNPNGQVSFLLQAGTGDAASLAGKAMAVDIAFYLPTTGNTAASATQQAYLADVHWEVGPQSVMAWCYNLFQYNNGLNVTAPTRNIVQIDNGGGGRIYGWQGGGDYGPNSASGFSLRVSNNSQTTLYGANIEHASGAAFYGFVNATNVRLLGQKSEDGGERHWFYVSNSNNVMLSGLTNHDPDSALFIDAASTNVSITASNYYAVTSGFNNPRIIDPTAQYPYANNYPLFKLGHFVNDFHVP